VSPISANATVQPTVSSTTTVTSAPTTQSEPATVQAPAPTPSKTDSQTTQGTSQNTSSNTKPSESAPKGKVSVGGLGLALSLEIFVKPGIPQPNLFPVTNMSQEIPKEIQIQDSLLMELLGLPPITQTPLKEYLEFEQ